MSEAGTAKTRVHLEAWARRYRDVGKALLVLAPKSVLQPVWAAEIERFLPHYGYSIACAGNREEAYDAEADIVITNTDAVSWLARPWPRLCRRFDTLIVDESSYFRNPGSQRSQALSKIKRQFRYRVLLSGTLTGKSVTDLWHQLLILDDGARLGRKFYRFRDQVQYPVQVGREPEHVIWDDRSGAETAVAELIADITIRQRFEDCVDIPEHMMRTIEFQLPPRHRAQYRALARQSNESSGIHGVVRGRPQKLFLCYFLLNRKFLCRKVGPRHCIMTTSTGVPTASNRSPCDAANWSKVNRLSTPPGIRALARKYRLLTPIRQSKAL